MREEYSSLPPEQLRARIVQHTNDVLAANCAGVYEPADSSAEGVEKLSFGLNCPNREARGVSKLSELHSIFSSPSALSSICDAPLLHLNFLLTWQLILDEPSEAIKTSVEDIMPQVLSLPLSAKERTVVHLQHFHFLLSHYEYEKALAALKEAMTTCGLEMELSGEMGKRTRFQVKEVAQLVLKTKGSQWDESEDDVADAEDVPVDVANQDDTLLNKMELSEGRKESLFLSSVDLALLLAMCTMEAHSGDRDELLVERCDAFLQEIIAARRCWSVQMSALALRSRLERSKKRRVERACMQSELLMNTVLPQQGREVRGGRRVSLLLASGLAPFWRVKAAYAQALIALGCVSEALLLYESLENWDEVVSCYSRMGQPQKAESVLRKLLEVRKEDVNILCSLGDITNNREYYDRAIQVSGDRSARAHKALGMMHLQGREHGEALTHFTRSLHLQPIQLGVWFNAGHCAWVEKKYPEAVSAYHRCVSLEPEHFEAWNNLSAAYIRLGQKERAARILSEALKFNYDHAKVWENYLLLCVDTCNVKNALIALHRLADLKKKVEDDEVIEAIVQQVKQDESADLVENACKTLGHLAACQQLSGRQWRAYALLREREGTSDKAIPLLEKAVHAFITKTGWERDEEAAKRVLECAVQLTLLRMSEGKASGSDTVLQQARSRARMSLRQVLGMLDRSEEEYSPTVKEGIEQANSLLLSLQTA